MQQQLTVAAGARAGAGRQAATAAAVGCSVRATAAKAVHCLLGCHGMEGGGAASTAGG